MAKKRRLRKILYHVFTLCFGFVMVYPLIWIIMTSFRERAEI